jgi:hypothetical protein
MRRIANGSDQHLITADTMFDHCLVHNGQMHEPSDLQSASATAAAGDTAQSAVRRFNPTT